MGLFSRGADMIETILIIPLIIAAKYFYSVVSDNIRQKKGTLKRVKLKSRFYNNV